MKTASQISSGRGLQYLLVPKIVNEMKAPDSKDVAEVVHHVVEFVLQLLEEVASFHIKLKENKMG